MVVAFSERIEVFDSCQFQQLFWTMCKFDVWAMLSLVSHKWHQITDDTYVTSVPLLFLVKLAHWVVRVADCWHCLTSQPAIHAHAPMRTHLRSEQDGWPMLTRRCLFCTWVTTGVETLTFTWNLSMLLYHLFCCSHLLCVRMCWCERRLW